MRKIALAIFALLGLAGNILADAPQWEFAPQHLGSALLGGGWMTQQTLGVVNGSPEFYFPLQLVYLSNNTQSGMFSDQWFCPQLESNILPHGRQQLLWRTPSGDHMLLTAGAVKTSIFADPDQKWQAKVSGLETDIWNTEGWQYVYKEGRLASLTSPTGRVMEFTYKGSGITAGGVTQMVLRDSVSGATRVLLLADYDPERRVTALSICGITNRFGYGNTRDGRLVAWQRETETQPTVFGYEKMGELASIQPAAGDAILFTTKYAAPAGGNGSGAEQLKPGNYRLLDDGVFKYTYGDLAEGKAKYQVQSAAVSGIVTTITAVDKQGQKLSLSLDIKQASITNSSTAAGIVEKTYFYRAPGQKFDGKIWRIERNGVVVAEYHYDKKTGLLLDVRDQNGVSTLYEYAAPQGGPADSKPVRILHGTPQKIEVVASMKYDNAGRLTEQTDATGQITKVNYNQRNEIESVIDHGGKVAITHDAFGRSTGVSVSDSGSTMTLNKKMEYGENGTVHSQTTPDGQVTTYAYDVNGNVSEVVQNGILVAKYDRDKQGQLVAQTDAMGRVKKFDYDAHGNLLAEHQPNGSMTKYEYDAQNRRIAQIDGDGNRISFAYDKAGRMIEQKNPLGEVQTWNYDENGRLKNHSNGVQSITYAYDANDRLATIDYDSSKSNVTTPPPTPTPALKPVQIAAPRTRKNYFGSLTPEEALSSQEQPQPPQQPVAPTPMFVNRSSQGVHYEYDEKGRFKRVSTPATSVSYSYDSVGRMIAKQLTRSGTDCVIRYVYNARGQKISVALSERSDPKEQYQILLQTNYHYDALGRLIVISAIPEAAGQDTMICSYQYDGAGRLASRQFGNGITGKYQYDGFGRQSRLELSGGPLGDPLVLEYQWDMAGQLLARHWNNETQTYTYDPSGQLLTVSAVETSAVQPVSQQAPISPTPTLIESYRYDFAGNLIQKSEGDRTTLMSYNKGNELVSSSFGKVNVLFTYDKAGRLAEEWQGQGDGKIEHTYGYLDKALSITRPDGTRNSFEYWPDGQLAAAYDDTSKHQQMDDYIWDDLALIEHNGETYAVEPHPNGGSCVARFKNGQISYDINDLLGTTLAVVSDTHLHLSPLTAFGRPKSVPPNPGVPAPLEAPVAPTQNPNSQQQTMKTK